jgi:alanyl-tRNA synthetase
MLTDKELKKQKKKEFNENFEKFYPVKTLKQMGFSRYICSKCGRGFWSTNKRDVCNDPACDKGYTFIGKKNLIKRFDYKQAYDLHVKFYKKFGYKPIKRYPVVARWYDKLFFVAAGINIFQPYVVSGEVPPPYPAVLEDQFCLRFNDVDNVGITGSHYTGFIMIGHHVFNTPKKYLYFKDEGVKQFTDFFVKELKVPKDALVLHEDVWVGGGNFGPCIEFFAYGLELGNQVYIQYEQLPDGSYRELQTKVIDMGSGAERWVWLSSGEPLSYDVVFPKVMNYLYKQTGIKPNKKIWEKYGQWASLLNIDEVENIDAAWKTVADKVGVSVEELKKEVLPVAALYSIADHTRTLLVAINDGEFPSNVGGGFNLRNILRRCFAFIDKYGWNIDLDEVFRIHVKEFGKWYTDLKATNVLFEILALERERYNKTIEEAKSIVKNLQTSGKPLTTEQLVTLYESKGITPELISQIAPVMTIPKNFYSALDELKERSKAKQEEITVDVAGMPKTKLGYRENPEIMKFSAKVLDVKGPYIILDKTNFYPRSGGQDYDLGTINKLPLKAVWTKDGVILHELLHKGEFKSGQKVNCEIDCERRNKLALAHTAVHVVGDACRKVLGPHVNQAGSEKTVEKARLDITHYQPLSFKQIQEIEKVANQLIKKKIKVQSKILPRGEAESKYGVRIYQGGAVPGKELRIIIVGEDVQACGGTHASSTKDIKCIKLINVERVKDGIVRLEFMVADKALEKIQQNEKILNELSKMWDISYGEITKTATKFFEEWKEMRKEMKELKEKYVDEAVKSGLAIQEKLIVIKDLPTNELGLLISALGKAKLHNRAVILIGKNIAYGRSETDVNILDEMKKYCAEVQGSPKQAKGFKLR